MLTSSAAETLVNVETVIIDEIHALAPTKRGAHLMLSLERLEEITNQPPQRIGLSATQRPLEEVARFLGGLRRRPARRGRSRSSTPASASRSTSTSSSRSRTWATSAGDGPARPDELRSGPASARHDAAAHEHLAEHLPADPRPDPRAPHHDHLLQRPPPGRAAGGQAQRARPRSGIDTSTPRRRQPRRRAGQGAPRLARPRAADRHRGPAEARRAARPSSPPAASSSASTWAPSTWSSRSSRPARSAAACSASAGPATRSASRAGARSTRSTAATCSRRRSSRGG